ncbi:hypothetical protein BDB01DRAFT_210463 [Pilobolus umbonatus]|nr:hypothetical protein BDB01DRAFT_210463 [Pilobolus umbonatus]
MPHSSATVHTMPTKGSIVSMPTSYLRNNQTLTDDRQRYPTTPPSSTASIELAPIRDYCNSVNDHRPPSPDSPKLKTITEYRHPRFHPYQAQLPSYLEPTPQFCFTESNIFKLDLFTLKENHLQSQPSHKHIPTVQIPIPVRSSSAYSTKTGNKLVHKSTMTCNPSKLASPSLSPQLSPISPTMAAASASAASFAALRHPGSHVAETLLKSLRGYSNKSEFGFAEPHEDEDMEEEDLSSFPSPDGGIMRILSNVKGNNVDQSMFLTKNAHIKRPRNAWIHFRCHYGQALKTQDPTLRAEEISKRASRRWAKLSENEKKPWHGLAEQEKLAHREAFPEYRYCPRRANSTNYSPSSPPVIGRARSASEMDNTIEIHDLFNSGVTNDRSSSIKRVKRKIK